MYLRTSFLSAAAFQISQATHSSRQSKNEPCAEAAGYVVRADETTPATIPADIAYACLQSVPVDTQTNIQLIDEYKVFIEWQSTLSYLKDPPEGYDNPAVDVIGSLDNIKQKLQDNDYLNEYNVHRDIWQLVVSAHDGHFNYDADILNVFQWGRSLQIRSLSRDGQEPPAIHAIDADTRAVLPSAITNINDQDVTDFVNDAAQWTTELDADARYNNMFPTYAIRSGRIGNFMSPPQYVGPWTNVTFADESSHSYQNIAAPSTTGDGLLRFNWTDVTDGQSLFEACCVLSSSSLKEKRSNLRPITHVKTPMGPLELNQRQSTITPEFSSNSTSINTYLLDSAPDVAVITISSFSRPDTSDVTPTEFPFAFQQEFLTLIQTAHLSNRTKIIIDLRGNGGGDGVLAWDSFRALFPTTEPADVTRFRANEAFMKIGEAVKVVLGNETMQEEDSEAYAAFQNLRDWNWQVNLQPNGSHYTSADALYGPVQLHNDNFTNLIRRDLSEPLSYGVENFTIIGYGARAHSAIPLYQASDVIMLHDGICHSTCAAFSEFMKNAGHVRSVVVGGRPQTGPMQAVAGTKGGFTFTSGTIRDFANTTISALSFLDLAKAQGLNQTVLGDLASGKIGQTLDRRSVSAQMNCEDNIQQSDKDMVPLQFVYEAADCRLYYTSEMITDPMEIWRRTADAIWNSGPCVANSTGHPSSLSGGDNYDPDGNSTPQDGAGGTGAGSIRGVSRSLLVLIVAIGLGLNTL